MSKKKRPNLPTAWFRHAHGHKDRPTGAGMHDARPNRLRSRGDRRRNALRDQADGA